MEQKLKRIGKLVGHLQAANCDSIDEGSNPLEVLKDYVRLFNSGDVEGVINLYTEDGILVPPTGPPARGHNEIEKATRGSMEAGSKFETLENLKFSRTSTDTAWTLDRIVIIDGNGAKITGQKFCRHASVRQYSSLGVLSSLDIISPILRGTSFRQSEHLS